MSVIRLHAFKLIIIQTNVYNVVSPDISYFNFPSTKPPKIQGVIQEGGSITADPINSDTLKDHAFFWVKSTIDAFQQNSVVRANRGEIARPYPTYDFWNIGLNPSPFDEADLTYGMNGMMSPFGAPDEVLKEFSRRYLYAEFREPINVKTEAAYLQGLSGTLENWLAIQKAAGGDIEEFIRREISANNGYEA